MRESDHQRFWILLVDALVTGLIALFVEVPPEIKSVVYSIASQLPGGRPVVGAMFFGLSIAMIVARYRSSEAARVVHAITGGWYALLGVGLCLAVLVGEFYTATNGFHLVVIAWIHYRAAVEQKPIVGEDKNG
jgi:hypothetical protein